VDAVFGSGLTAGDTYPAIVTKPTGQTAPTIEVTTTLTAAADVTSSVR
jgi:hypothetical protein